MKDKTVFFIVNTARDGRVDSKDTERSTTVFKGGGEGKERGGGPYLLI